MVYDSTSALLEIAKRPQTPCFVRITLTRQQTYVWTGVIPSISFEIFDGVPAPDNGFLGSIELLQ